MATTSSKAAALARAIDAADVKILRDVLKSMCKESEVCREAAMARMLVSRKREVIELSDSSDNDAKGKQSKKQKKVEKKQEETPTSRFAKCINCEETYDVTLNHDTACQTHDELLEIDPDYFPDDDQVTYEPWTINVNTDWRRKDFPQGFRYQCCDVDVNGKPCVIQKHIPTAK